MRHLTGVRPAAVMPIVSVVRVVTPDPPVPVVPRAGPGVGSVTVVQVNQVVPDLRVNPVTLLTQLGPVVGVRMTS